MWGASCPTPLAQHHRHAGAPGTGILRAPRRLHWVPGEQMFKPPDQPAVRPLHKEMEMLHYAVVFLVIALIAALFGFGGIAAGAVGIAKILFFVFVIMAVVTFVLGLLKKG